MYCNTGVNEQLEAKLIYSLRKDFGSQIDRQLGKDLVYDLMERSMDAIEENLWLVLAEALGNPR